MEEKEIPDLGAEIAKLTATENKPINFIDMAKNSLNKGTGIDPLFFSDIMNEFKKDGINANLVFDKPAKDKVREQYGDEGLKQWEELFDATLSVNKLSQDKDFYESYASPTMFNKASGIKNFKEQKIDNSDLQGEFARGFRSNIAIKTPEMIAENAPSIIDYDPMKGYFNRELKGDSINSIAAMFGEDKRLTIATNEVVASTDPILKQKIKDGLVDSKAYFKDDNGVYRYRTLQKGERPTDNIRSVWGPQMLYHNSYGQELLESLNDFAMDSLDAVIYVNQFSTGMALNLTQKGATLMGIDATWADAWNDNFHDYRNWSQSRRSTKSWEDEEGTFSNMTNFSKGVVQIAAQIFATKGMGLVGGLGSKVTGAGMKYLGKSLSDDAARAMMSRTAMGYNFMYAGSMANEHARTSGLGDTESHAMGIAAGAVMMLTEKLTGGQFIDKVLGPIRGKVYAKKIIQDISDQAEALGMTAAQVLKDEKTFRSVIGSVVSKTNNWLSETAKTRGQNTLQGFVGEAVQESTEDSLNTLTQEFRDWIAGEDSYDNTWKSAANQLAESFVLGGIGGAIGGAAFFNKKHWEMSYIDESKFDWMTAAALKGEIGIARKALEQSRKEGTLGSTLFSAMQNNGASPTPMSLEKDPVAMSQNELLYTQFSAQMNLVEEMAKKYETHFTTKEDLGNFMMGVTGGKAFVNSDEFGDIEKNTSHMMQREAVAFEIKRNHAKSMLALEVAKATGAVDLSEIESIHAFKGKVISIKRRGNDSTESPNTLTKNALEEGLREVEDNGPGIAKVRKAYNDLYLAQEAFKEAEYNADKNPMNPEFVEVHKIAKEKLDKLTDTYKKEVKEAKLSEDAIDILDDLTNYDNLEQDFKNDDRKKFYNQKAVLEMSKIQYAQFLSNYKGMTVYDFKMKEKDRQFFNGSMAFEDQTRKELAVQYDTIIGELAGLNGQDLESKIAELIALQASSKNLFLSPQSKAIVDQKVAELVHSNKLKAASDLQTFGIKAGTDLTDQNISDIARLALIVAELGKDDALSEEVLEEIEMYKNANMPLHMAMLSFQGFMKDASVDVLLEAVEANFEAIATGLSKLKSLGISYPGFDLAEIEAGVNLLMSKEFSDFKSGENTLNQLQTLAKFSPMESWIDSVKSEMALYFLKLGIDFSAWEGEDLEMLGRAMNMNQSRNDMAGGSIISKMEELEREHQKSPDEFSDLTTIEALKKELMENRMEIILEHTINDWGLTNNSEKFKDLLKAMGMTNLILTNLYQAAQGNMNKRSGRDYKIKQDYVNFHSKALIALSKVINLFSPEELSELSNLLVVSGETYNDDQKKEVNKRLERLIDFEEQMSKAIQVEVKKEGRSLEILNAMNMTMSQLFTFGASNNLTRSAFRDLHEDIESPYDPKNEASAKEQLFNFLVQMERGNVRTFFNRFNQILNESVAKTTDLPSFEQALSARQLFGFLMDKGNSTFKDALNAQISPILNNDGQVIGKAVVDNHQIFIRGIAGAGKSTFVTKLAFQLFGDQMKLNGGTVKTIFSAPNSNQIENIGKTMKKTESEGLSAESFELQQIYAMKGLSGSVLEGVSVIVIDEATLEGEQLSAFMDNLSIHNENAPEGSKIKLVLIGDEFQNGPETMFVTGMPLFYNWRTSTVLERTVPLTSPYRTGKIESFGLQMNHRKMISEFNKIQKALKYGLPYKHIESGKDVQVTDKNWNKLAMDVFNFYNGNKVFNFFEKKKGIIDYGVRSFNQKEEVLTAFLDKLADVENKNDVAIIIHGTDKAEILSELGKLAVTLKLSFDAGSLAPYVYTSQEIQGLSRPHVFVAIDIQNALVASGDIGVLKTAFQALYVAESREEESLTIWLPGNHASVKNVSKNAIFSYPKVDMDDKKEDGTPTEKVLELQKENLNLVDLIKRISRSEEIDPEKNKPNEQTGGIENKGIEESEEIKKPKKTPPKVKKTVKTEEKKVDLQNQLENNVNGNVWEELHKDPAKFFKEALEKYPTVEDALKALEEDQFGACNLD